METVARKACSKCREALPLESFSRNRCNRDGLDYYCRDCRNGSSKQWKLENAEHVEAQAAGYREVHRADMAAKAMEKYWADPATHIRRVVEWLADHPEYVRARRRRHYARHRDEVLAKCKAYRDANPEKREAYRAANAERTRLANARYLAQKPEVGRRIQAKRNAIKRGATIVSFSQSALDAKLAYWGNRCWVCGGSQEAVDHVKPLSKGGPHCLANLRPICKRCNSRKKDKWPYSA